MTAGTGTGEGPGTVTLVGGGPGDPELMTVGGLRALASADVVLYDRLAPRALLAEWAPRALLIDVGKTPGHHAVPQEKINELLVEHAIAGRCVVRLKGGDPFVFGRGGEELEACTQHGVPVRVLPGVSSAIAVPSAAGVPVTHRAVSRAFTVISGHVPLSDDELAALVRLGGTIVVLMGVSTLPQLGAGLLRHGMGPEMPLVVIERGFSADQRVSTGTLGTLVRLLGEAAPRSPAVIVIGEVVRHASTDELSGLLTEARV
jgi:uroporphyrin-III C-methyltransferase